jgi:hypothetical protein
MAKDCRIAWRAPTGKTGHGTKWVTRATCERYIKVMRERELKYPEKDRLVYKIETWPQEDEGR